MGRFESRRTKPPLHVTAFTRPAGRGAAFAVVGIILAAANNVMVKSVTVTVHTAQSRSHVHVLIDSPSFALVFAGYLIGMTEITAL